MDFFLPTIHYALREMSLLLSLINVIPFSKRHWWWSGF